MKKQSKTTYIVLSKTETVTNGESTPIKPKSRMPKGDKSSRKKSLYQLIEDQITHAPISNSIQVKEQPKELKE